MYNEFYVNKGEQKKNLGKLWNTILDKKWKVKIIKEYVIYYAKRDNHDSVEKSYPSVIGRF